MFNPQLYFVVDPSQYKKKDLIFFVETVLIGGVTCIQLRDKVSSTRDTLQIGEKLFRLAKKYHVSLIINDRVDIALALGANGVHLGQEDMPINMARKLLGLKKIIGVSVKTKIQAKEAEREGATYLGCGAVFATQSKSDAGNPIGLKRLKDVVDSVAVPVVAIGGITEGNAESVLQTGVAGIATISAIMQAKNPRKATERLRQKLNERH